MKYNLCKENSFTYTKPKLYQQLEQILAKVNSSVDTNYTLIKKLGAGCCGTVYKINADINGKSLEIVHKTFINKKYNEPTSDDYNELYANWQMRKYISENALLIAKDDFLFDCTDKVPFLYLTKEQKNILSKSKSPAEEYKNAQITSDLKHGIFFEIKGNQNLDDLINDIECKKVTLSFDDKMKLLLDILMGATLLDKAGIIQRDFNCENIQIDFSSNEKRPKAYLIDFGKAIHKEIIHLFDDDENEKNDYCGPFYYSSPPEANEIGNKDKVFGDKYNSYNVGLVILPLFFGKKGYDLMFDFKWSDNDDIIKNRKELFNNCDIIIDKLNKTIDNLYNAEQIKIIKVLLKKLINPDANIRSNSEEIARSLYYLFYQNDHQEYFAVESFSSQICFIQYFLMNEVLLQMTESKKYKTKINKLNKSKKEKAKLNDLEEISN